MIQQTKRRPPLPVLTALAVMVMGYTAVIAVGPWARAGYVIGNLMVAALAVALIYGLWRGSSVARGATVLLMVWNLVFGFLNHIRISVLRVADRRPGGRPRSTMVGT